MVGLKQQNAGKRCDLCECVTNDGQLGVLHATWEHGSRHAGERYRVQLCEGCFFQSLSYIRQEREIQHLFDDQPLDDREFGLIRTGRHVSADSPIQLDMPNSDAEALLRFVQQANTRAQCPSDPWEASRLESALEALAEALEASLK